MSLPRAFFERSPLINILSRFLATGAYSGYAPIAPGSAGTLVGLGLYLLIPASGSHLWVAGLLALLAIGVKVSGDAEAVWGKDPPSVVIDEIFGFGVTVALLPKSVKVAVAGFVLFRLLDIVKPAPARQLERLHGGWGVMLDDLVAGIYGNLLLRLGAFAYHRLLY